MTIFLLSAILVCAMIAATFSALAFFQRSRSEKYFQSEAEHLKNELSAQLKIFSDTTIQTLTLIGENQNRMLSEVRRSVEEHLKTLETSNAEKQEKVRLSLGEFALQQKNNADSLVKTLGIMGETQNKSLAEMRLTIEKNLNALQKDNAEKLEKMRTTVDEKLQSTLEKRLSESFKLVSERLAEVCKGLGEMRNLASGVGDLKRVLTNVKARGTWGEIQLGAMLKEVLTPEQYLENVSTKNNTERVEFAVRLPGKGENEAPVLLPIDAKFPVEDYQRLLDAADHADADALESAAKQLENRLKGCAKDICEKYLNPPVTTDFALLYLPTEGLFAEAMRRNGLSDTLQRQYRVVIAGPSTLWSLLNSLQMGFRTLAIERRSSEVWTMLEAVKTEWQKYDEALDAVQKKIQQASDSLNNTHVRVRAVGRKLRGINALDSAEKADHILELNVSPDVPEEDADNQLL